MRKVARIGLAVVAGLGFAAAPAGAQSEAGPECSYNPRLALDERLSPLDSVVFSLGGAAVKVCYGRPAARGRTMLGGEDVPYGELWRTGANEPTVVHVPIAAEIAGLAVGPGSYSLYTIPGEREWTVIVNRSTSQWGHERMYTDEVRAQEVGRAVVQAARRGDHVEAFTISAEPAAADAVTLRLEWEHTRVDVPIRARR